MILHKWVHVDLCKITWQTENFEYNRVTNKRKEWLAWCSENTTTWNRNLSKGLKTKRNFRSAKCWCWSNSALFRCAPLIDQHMRLCRESYNKPARVHIYISFSAPHLKCGALFLCVCQRWHEKDLLWLWWENQYQGRSSFAYLSSWAIISREYHWTEFVFLILCADITDIFAAELWHYFVSVIEIRPLNTPT